MIHSFVAIGDSFTEGVGDSYPDGRLRGWADLVAYGLARAAARQGETVDYANLAIRGRKLAPLLAEQLEPAIAQRPELISINGGGNDLIRPRVTVAQLSRRLRDATQRITDAGIHALVIAGPDPTRNIPLGPVVHFRGRHLTDAMAAWCADMPEVTYLDEFDDEVLREAPHWSADGIHMTPLGHLRVASSCLTALEVPMPAEWAPVLASLDQSAAADFQSLTYWRRYVLPWIARRLTGRSAGRHHLAKRPMLTPVALDRFADARSQSPESMDS